MKQDSSYILNEILNNKIQKSKKYLFFAILTGFIMGQAEIGFNFYPFSLIYWTLFIYSKKYIVIMISLSVFAGLVYTGTLVNLLYLFSGISGYMLFFLFKRKVNSELLITLVYFLASTGINYYLNESIYTLFLIIVESAFIFMAISIIKEKNGKIPLIILSSGLLIGLVSFFNGNLSYLILNILIITIVTGAGFFSGISVSILLSAVYGLAFVIIDIISLNILVKYMIIALITGLFRGKNKLFVFLVLPLSLLLYSGLSPSLNDFRLTAIEILISSFLFLIIPGYLWIELIGDYPENSNRESIKEEKIDLGKRFSEISRVFFELSSTFEDTLVKKDKEQERRLEDFVFLYKNKLCKSCSRKKICWYREKKQTYKTLKNLAEEVQNYDKLNNKIIKNSFKNKCPRYLKIVKGIKSIFELFQLNNFWRDKLIKKQKIVSRQLSGISKIINQLGKNRNRIYEYNRTLEKIKNKFQKNSLELSSIKLNSSEDLNKISINVELDPCSGNEPCKNRLLYLLNKEFNDNFRILKKECGSKLKDYPCHLVYAPVGNYSIDITVMQKTATEIAGDNYLYKKMKNGKDAIILSDGMGVGKKASTESKTAINLLESFIDADFDQDLALKSINSALFLRNEEENFTTMDICFFDTYTGELEFKKIGAMSSFIKRNWEVKEIKSSSLPAGILKKIDISSKKIKLKENDFVIMITDGVLDVKKDITEKENWFKRIIQNTCFDKPQDMINYIMETVLENCNNIEDDMTIIVFKIDKNKKNKGNTGLFIESVIK